MSAGQTAIAAPTSDARTRILDAAETIVRARGVPGLTLEAAAREAGVSKGGLLYHFASKEALLAALLAPVGRVRVRRISPPASTASRPARAASRAPCWPGGSAGLRGGGE